MGVPWCQQAGEAKRVKIYGKYGKLIIAAVKQGGGSDPVSNMQLKKVLDSAQKLSVPRDLIERNIKKASDAKQADYMELTYEAYGAGGVVGRCNIDPGFDQSITRFSKFQIQPNAEKIAFQLET